MYAIRSYYLGTIMDSDLDGIADMDDLDDDNDGVLDVDELELVQITPTTTGFNQSFSIAGTPNQVTFSTTNGGTLVASTPNSAFVYREHNALGKVFQFEFATPLDSVLSLIHI